MCHPAIRILAFASFFIADFAVESDDYRRCYEKPSEYKQACDKLNGIRLGGLCYFLSNANSSWDNAQTTCEAENGTLAQVQTVYELTQVSKQLLASSNEMAVWLALRRFTTDTNGYVFNLAETKWVPPNDMHMNELTANTTFLRTLTNDVSSAVGACYKITKTGEFRLDYCTKLMNSLCQLKNKHQDYNKMGVCLGESPVVEGIQPTVDDCADQCASFIWCRGFNYRIITTQCGLFTWDVDDTDNKAVVDGCVYYNRVK